MAGTAHFRRPRPRRARAKARCGAPEPRGIGTRCDAAARPGRATTTTGATPDDETDGWLTEHRLEPELEPNAEPGDERPRGTYGRGRLSVEAPKAASALDDSSGPLVDWHPSSQVVYPSPGNEPALAAVIDADPGAAGDPRTLVAFGGITAMRLQTLDPLNDLTPEAGPAPSAHSMRFMETGLAFIAIIVALLLNSAR